MLNIVLTVLILVLVYGVYSLCIKPARRMKYYAKFLRAQGYKVYEIPFSPLRDHFMSFINKGIQKGDPIAFYKQIGVNYDVVVTNELWVPLLEFNNIDFIKDFNSLDKHYQYPKIKKVIDFFARLGGYGVVFSQGQVWKRKRIILNKIFNFDFVKSQSQKISRICSEAIQDLEATGKKNEENNSVVYGIQDLAVRTFSEIMIECFLGATKQERIMGQPAGRFLKKLVDDLTEQSFEPINFLLGPKFLRLRLTKSHKQIQDRVQAYRSWAYGFIKKRIQQINEKIERGEQEKDGYDIIEAFLRAKKVTQNQKDAIFSVEEIYQQVTSLFVGGTDTTTTFTQHMIYLIVTHPEIERKLREQIQTYMKDDDYSYENLKNLTYIDLIQKETTRYIGAAASIFYRVANADNYINGLPVKKGTGVSIMHHGNHFSEKYFKNPEEFRPERWESECDNIPPFVMGGFSAGARACLGKHLAHLESKIALIKFFKRYKKIILGKPNFKMQFKFLYGPEWFESTMIIDEACKK